MKQSIYDQIEATRTRLMAALERLFADNEQWPAFSKRAETIFYCRDLTTCIGINQMRGKLIEEADLTFRRSMSQRDWEFAKDMIFNVLGRNGLQGLIENKIRNKGKADHGFGTGSSKRLSAVNG